MVLAFNTGVVNELPIPNCAPPNCELYQLIVADWEPYTLAIKVAVFPEQIVALATEMVSSLHIGWLVNPAPPMVAPFGKNSLT